MSFAQHTVFHTEYVMCSNIQLLFPNMNLILVKQCLLQPLQKFCLIFLNPSFSKQCLKIYIKRHKKTQHILLIRTKLLTRYGKIITVHTENHINKLTCTSGQWEKSKDIYYINTASYQCFVLDIWASDRERERERERENIRRLHKFWIYKYYQGDCVMVMTYDYYYVLMEKEIKACIVSVVKLVGKRALEGPRRRCQGIIRLQLIGRNR